MHRSNEAAALLKELQSLDIRLTTHGDRLKIDAPKGHLAESIRARIVEFKAELISLCQAQSAPDAPPPVYRFIPVVPRTERLAASFAQQRMWFVDKLDGGGSAYNIPILLHFEGTLHRRHLTEALQEIVRRHEVLRTVFREPEGDDDVPWQVILPPRPLSILWIDLTESPPAENRQTVETMARKAGAERFDLANGPLLHVQAIQTAPREHYLIFTVHHVVFDGLSLAVFLDELRALYTAFLRGQPSPLPELEIQYADFSVWQRESLTKSALSNALDFWKSSLAGAPPQIELPTDHPRPSIQTFRGAREALVIDAALTEKLRALSRAQGVTLFMTLHAAFAVLLSRYTKQTDVVIGVPVSGRNHRQLEGLLGLFVNTLALRTHVDGRQSFADLLQQIKNNAQKAYRYQDLPFERLIADLNVARSLAHNPIFQVMLAVQEDHVEGITLPDLTISTVKIDHAIAKFDLTLILHERREDLVGCLEYSTDLFESATIQRMIGHLRILLQAASDDPSISVARLPILTPPEKQQILFEFNPDQDPHFATQSFPRCFEEQAARTPNAIAAIFHAQRLTYAELNRRSNRWAWQLIQHGVRPGDIVVLAADRSIDYLTAFLSILKAGAVYLPCDPTHPSARLIRIQEQARPKVIMTERFWLPVLQESSPPPLNDHYLCFDDLDQLHSNEDNVAIHLAPEDPAYVIFTSGSTGTPKGAIVHHGGMVNHLYAMCAQLSLGTEDRIAQNAPQMFDISIWQFLVAGLIGATVHILDRETASDPERLAAAVDEQGITILEIVPSLMRVVLESIAQGTLSAGSLERLRWLIPTGEALPPSLATQWLQRYPSIPLLNAYGPAECSDDVTCYPVRTPPASSMSNMPIGRPVANMRVYLLDAYRELVPIGVPGEIYIGGVGVGLGYLNDEIKTAEAFFIDPFCTAPHQRLYKTGDLGRFLPDGNIEYLGRVDDQVKIRGFRVELGEIEGILKQHEAVQEGVIIARTGAPGLVAGENQVVAYVCLARPIDDASVELRSWLKSRLPDYMLPTAIVILDKMPLSPNGKTDRKALRERSLEATEVQGKVTYVPPRDSLELRLVRCWGRLLGVSPIGVLDNFFDLGGDSLLAIRLVNNIQQEFGVKIPLQALFQHSTVEGIVSMLRGNATPAPWSPLVCLQPKGNQTPLFFVHAAGGIVFRYLQVAALLGAERPFYGLQARGIEKGDPFYSSIEEMAAHYVEAIRSVQPTGPYLIGGWSFGGSVAFEMARLLEKSGEAVPVVLMVDAPSPWVDSFAEDDVEFLLERLRPAAGLALEAIDQYSSKEAKLAYLINEQRLAGLFAPDIDDAYARHRLALHKHHNEIICRYRPTGSIAGKLVFYKPMETIPFDVRMKEPTTEWIPFAQGGIDVDDAPGNHFNMFSSTNGPVLAEKLKACIKTHAHLFDRR